MLKTGKEQLALEYTCRALELFESSDPEGPPPWVAPRLHFQRAMIHRALGDERSARGDFDKVKELDPRGEHTDHRHIH